MNDEVIKTFFERLDELNSGDRAALRREAGVILKDAKGQAIRTFYQCLPYAVPQWQEEYFFAAACLHCLWGADEQNRAGVMQILYELGRKRRRPRARGTGSRACWIRNGTPTAICLPSSQGS